MNPELQRNIWLELTPRRMGLMVIVLVLIFFAAASTSRVHGPAAAAQFLFYVIVVLWGTRNAAMAVIGEIRDRTWDSQRLSSIGAAQMTIGKLFGATIYNWFGGIVCLAVIFAYMAQQYGFEVAAFDFVRYVAVGGLAQGASLLASLIAARRRQAHSRFDIFIYQLVGLGAAGAFHGVWQLADPAATAARVLVQTIPWWGTIYPARPFLLLSLAIFVAWLFLGCYRQMRVELKMRNGPWMWLGFNIFMGVYTAGFAGLGNNTFREIGLGTERLLLACAAFSSLTYIAAILEPKDRVLYRWLYSCVASGKIWNAIDRIQAWMTSYSLCMLAAILLFANMMVSASGISSLLVVAGASFLTRDLGIILFFAANPTRPRGDWAAVITLFVLYLVLPLILLKAPQLHPLFYPSAIQPAFSSLAGIVEAGVAWYFALRRFSLAERSVLPSAAAA